MCCGYICLDIDNNRHHRIIIIILYLIRINRVSSTNLPKLPHVTLHYDANVEMSNEFLSKFLKNYCINIKKHMQPAQFNSVALSGNAFVLKAKCCMVYIICMFGLLNINIG